MIYAIVHYQSGDTEVAYQGQSQVTIVTLLAEKAIPFDLIDKATYDSFVNAKPKFVPQADLVYQLEKAKGTMAAIAYIAKRLGLE